MIGSGDVKSDDVIDEEWSLKEEQKNSFLFFHSLCQGFKTQSALHNVCNKNPIIY